MEKLALSPAESRRALGLGRTTFYNLISSGELRTVRVGRRILVPATELERFLTADPRDNHKAKE